MKKKKSSIAAWSALFCLASGSLFAQTSNEPGKFYVGLQVGQSTLDRDRTDIEGEFDDHDVAYTAMVGYRFGPHYSLELSFSELGDFSADFASGEFGGTSLRNYTLNNVFVWPISPHFHLKGLLGVTYYDFSGNLTLMPSGTRLDFSDTNGSFDWGLGIGVPLTDRFELGLDYTQYRSIDFDFFFGDDEFNQVYETDASTVTLGARYRF